ncbi:MAG: SURF1 family cytochrome oxidase biogenesis protein [Gordonia sp. (in: high G+C Gram-positive bacteria)]
MRALRSVVRPGWIALVLVVAAFAVACFTVLAPWQLGKNSATSHRNDLIKSAVATAPVPLGELAPAGAGFRPDAEWREVTLTGTFLADAQALVRLRSVDERPAIEVLTPFRVAGSDRILAVDRGFVRPDQNTTPAIPAAPAGTSTITARIRAPEGTSPGRGARISDGARTLYTIDPAQLSTATGLVMDPFYLQLSPGQPGALGEIPLPQLDSGPYLSYGLQWLAFGIMAPLGVGYFLVAEVRQRRRAAAGDQSSSAATESGSGDGATPRPASTAGPTRTQRRKRLRADLQRAGSRLDDGDADLASAPTGIGAGPDAAHTSGAVRSKLSQRYGS